MRHRTLAQASLLLLLLLTTFHFSAATARADDDTDDKYADDSYEETARVARVSLLAGDVSLRRAGSNKWERAALNTPLVEGDRLATGAASRVEIQIDSRNFVRVGEYATIDIVTLRAEGVALSLPEGTATLRLARFDHDHEYFEIDAPGTTVAAQSTGLYRLDVDHDARVRVAVRDGGRARLYSESSGFTLHEGRVAQMIKVGSSDESDWEFSDLKPFDDWDTWVDGRERYLLARLSYQDRERYYDPQVYGAEELDAYGDWVQTKDYGYVWRPRATVINVYNDWAPYRYGHWDWCPPYGWIWVGDEAWGWAPYHYGRWVNVDNYWCWAPRGYYGYRHRAWWRPALVAFVDVNLSFGNHICWYPLPYHHSDPHSNFWRHARDRAQLAALQQRELANLQRLNPVYQHAVSGLPARDFTRGGVRAQPADEQLARLALSRDPVRGRLPIRPVEDRGGDSNLRDRVGADRRGGSRGGGDVATDDPSRHTFSRSTGAAKRLPGVALDDQLRRERIFNNREPVKGARGDANNPTRHILVDPDRRTTTGGDAQRRSDATERGNTTERGDATGRGNDTTDRRDAAGTRRDGATDRRLGDERTTGAVARPSRPDRTSPQADEKRTRGDGEAGERHTFPRERVEHNDTHEERNAQPVERNNAQPTERNAQPAERNGSPAERRVETPQRTDRPEPRYERTEPRQDRTEPRNERTEPRYERPEPRHEERSAPPPREERSAPPPREERSAPREERSSPPPREERSAPREERSSPREEKSSPPPKSEERHSEPARERSEPSRSKPPKDK